MSTALPGPPARVEVQGPQPADAWAAGQLGCLVPSCTPPALLPLEP